MTVLALRTLKTEDESITKSFLEKLATDAEKIGYAIVNHKGEVVADGSIHGAEESQVHMARLKASAAFYFGKDTADIKTLKTGNDLVDRLYSPGGALVKIDGVAVCGSVGISGCLSEGFSPGKVNNGDVAFALSRFLEEKA